MHAREGSSVARSINRTVYHKSLQVADQQLGNSLIHRCFHVGRRPVVKFMVVLQITSPLPSQLCVLRLHMIVEGPDAKCLRTKAGGAHVTHRPCWKTSSSFRSFSCQYLKPRFLLNITAN